MTWDRNSVAGQSPDERIRELEAEVERLRELMAEVAEHPACPHSCREDLLDALREPMP